MRQNNNYNWLLARTGFVGDECLIWPFCRDGRVGRGRLGVGGIQYWAHRLMCELAHGKPPSPKHQARHSCGNGHLGCVNPKHLSWATNSENQSDRRQHGTQKGAKGSRATITPADIAEIQAKRGIETQMSMAKRLGVSLGCIQYWQRINRAPVPLSPKRNVNTPQ